MASATAPRSLAVFIFAASIGVGACLLFQVQFILAKQILPWFGGAPAVWTTCMLFFQVALLLGYLYAHLVGRIPSARRQREIHLAAIGLAVALLLARVMLWPSPITPSDAWKPEAGDVPSLAILGLLLFTIGLPFLVLSATGPLLQSWYARCFPGVSPYRLYALSNVGSLVGLLSYPFVIEPLMSVTSQGWLWSVGFLVFALGCGRAAVLAGRTSVRTDTSHEHETPVAKPRASERALWFVLAMIASVLLLAITSQIALEVAVIPFLWMLPLALYLLSFVLCFEYERAYRRGLWIPLLLVGGGATTATIIAGVGAPVLVQLATYLSTLFVACMVCHGELVKRKPAPQHLTGFYLLVSAGGAAGGIFTGIVAPTMFLGLWELPLALVAACGLALFLGLRAANVGLKLLRIVAAVGGLYVIAIALALGWQVRDELSDNLHVSRGFFGVLRVDIQNDDGLRSNRLRHGRINHGYQLLEPEKALEVTSYYGPQSGGGLAIAKHPRRTAGESMRLGVVGLGVGTLAAYTQPGDTLRFYEIDPDVVALSQGPNAHFTYLRDAKGSVDVSIGDARVSLEREPPQSFDVLIVDAFSSDSIPAHLLTVEALELYLGHLRDAQSVLALHISNRYLDLDPVVRGAAQELDLAVIRVYDSEADDARYSSSDWMLLATDESAFTGILAATEDIEPPSREPPWPHWTDGYSNLLVALED